MIRVTRNLALGRMRYGLAPLPRGAELVGTVQREPGSPYAVAGALIRFRATGLYAECWDGVVRTLPQREVRAALDALPEAS